LPRNPHTKQKRCQIAKESLQRSTSARGDVDRYVAFPAAESQAILEI
jgi:hypothetical protein